MKAVWSWLRHHAGWVLGAALVLAAVTGAVLNVSAANHANPLNMVSTSLLRQLSAWGQVVASAWFVVVVLLLLFFGPQVRAFLGRLSNLEIQGVKLSAGDMKSLAPVLDPGSWYDRPTGGADAGVPGGDGPLLDRPDPQAADYRRYQHCLAAVRPLLKAMTMANQQETGERLKALEWSWHGDFTEELSLSVRLLREAIQEGRIIRYTQEYLATALLLRHMMLYLNGAGDHADQLLADLEWVDPEHATITMSHAYSIWFLITLCEHRRYRKVARIAAHPLLQDPRCRLSRAAYLAYRDLRIGHFEEALGRAVAALEGTPLDTDAAPVTLLNYVAAHCYLQANRPLDAVAHAEAILSSCQLRHKPLRTYLQRGARRLLVRACFLLEWRDRLFRLYAEDPEAAADPYVLNTLAVCLHKAGQVQFAAGLVNRALRLLRLTGDAEVRASVEQNARVLN